jgi:hypothetical protein
MICMKKLFIIFVIMLSGIVLAVDECEGTSQSCGIYPDCENCNDYDGYYGDRYCKYGDVYRIYRNYYCENNECVYEEEERIMDECEYCEEGQCIECDAADCDENDGYYGDRTCIYDDVYRIYRDYYCSYGKCIYKESYRKIEDCDYKCEHGECIPECPNHCADNVWFYDGDFDGEMCHYSMKNCEDYDKEYGRFCKNGDVYANFKNYYCTKDGCDYDLEERKVADCDDKCLGWSSLYTVGDGLERTRTCYSYLCMNGECVKKSEYTSIARKELLPTAQLIEKDKVYEFSVDVSHRLVKKTITSPENSIHNGLLFGSEEIVMEFPESYLKYIRFSVDETNLYAPLIIQLNDEVIYREFTREGNYIIKLNRTASGILKIRTESSGWRIWAPATYNLKGIELFTEAFSMVDNEFDFSLDSNVLDGFTAARITEWPENSNIILNSNHLPDTVINREHLVEGRNTIVFEPFFNSSSQGTAKLKIWYNEEVTV